VGISLRKTEASGVVTLSGPIGLDQLAVMNDYVDLLLTNQVPTIYFDFTGVQSLSVSAVGALSAIRDRVDENGGRLLLAGLTSDLNSLVDMDHLRRFFTVFDGPLPEDQEPEAGDDNPDRGETVPDERLNFDMGPDQAVPDHEEPMTGELDS
jgi:anti-anti-sigma factor